MTKKLKSEFKKLKMTTAPQAAITMRKIFRKFIKFDAFEKPQVNVKNDDDLKKLRLRFTGSFSTNGIDASFHLDRKIPTKKKMIESILDSRTSRE